ncbi:MAG TPA: hypothetical protein VN663_00655 [Ramlibacter sp.]|nr:hypothetical protein [Ramlibacter sp.]
MKLLIESAMVFFGTLMAAALVALTAPGVELVIAQEPFTAVKSAAQLLASNQPGDTHGVTVQRPVR